MLLPPWFRVLFTHKLKVCLKWNINMQAKTLTSLWYFIHWFKKWWYFDHSVRIWQLGLVVFWKVSFYLSFIDLFLSFLVIYFTPRLNLLFLIPNTKNFCLGMFFGESEGQGHNTISWFLRWIRFFPSLSSSNEEVSFLFVGFYLVFANFNAKYLYSL